MSITDTFSLSREGIEKPAERSNPTASDPGLQDEMGNKRKDVQKALQENEANPEEAFSEAIISDVYSEMEHHGGFLEIEITPRIKYHLIGEQRIKFNISWDTKRYSQTVVWEFLLANDWSTQENPYFTALDWQKVEIEEIGEEQPNNGPRIRIREIKPELNSPFLAKHLTPHLKQAAGKHGMTLKEYATRIHKDLEFRKQKEEWIKDPYYKVYGLKDGIKSGGMNTDSPLGGLKQNDSRMDAAEEAIQKRILEKQKIGDFRLRIANCGCGIGGNETYAYALYIHGILEKIARNILTSEKDIEDWVKKWHVEVTGYSIMPEHLRKAEQQDSWLFEKDPERLKEEVKNQKCTEYFFKGTNYTKGTGKKPHKFSLKQEIRKGICFEWIDLTDTEQLKRLGNELDVVILRRTFYIYSGPNGERWSSGPIKEAMNGMIGALGKGGIFITDNNIASLVHAHAEKAPSLAFKHPDLQKINIPSGKEMEAEFCFTAEKTREVEREIKLLEDGEDGEGSSRMAELKMKLKISNENREAYKKFINEIEERKGLIPTGVYLKYRGA